ncbi:MAG: coproporphyrinogen III oxidase [Alphaproteobacteria bacterium]|nr:coproporphyrinogen III oxidase [Alphaproteobacteria bacterium]
MPGGLFAVYVHWPFCLSKCPYCDFNSHVSAAVDHDAWRRAFENGIARTAALTPGRTVTSVFFGGGTPSLMEPRTVETVLEAIARHWTLDRRAEVTLEANPTSVEAGRFADFAAAGVNRVSLGIQALNDTDLAFLGRTHSAEEALDAIAIAKRSFPRSSFDLIYARPGQTVRSWQDELQQALDLAAGHLSLYQLTIEQGTRFATLHARGAFEMPDDDTAGALFETTREHLAAAGMPAYEISNHARPGQESLHNLTYWRYGDYAGIGPGAHGRLTIDGRKLATRGHRAPAIWLPRALSEDGHGDHVPEEVSPQEQATEILMMGLRLAEGVPLSRFESETGKPLHEWIDARKIDALRGEDLLSPEKETLRATDSGMQRLDGILKYLLG